MVDATRALLDELMGKDRDKVPSEKNIMKFIFLILKFVNFIYVDFVLTIYL